MDTVQARAEVQQEKVWARLNAETERVASLEQQLMAASSAASVELKLAESRVTLWEGSSE